MKLFAISYVVCLFACMAAGLVAVHPEQGSGTGSRDDLAPPERSTVIRNGTAEFIASSILDKRHEATWTASKMECGPRNDEYSVNEALTKESIDALRGKGGVYTLQRHACVRISCQYDSAIFWCNHSNVTRTVERKVIASGADLVRQKCRPATHPDMKYLTSGKAWIDDGLIVRVGGSKC